MRETVIRRGMSSAVLHLGVCFSIACLVVEMTYAQEETGAILTFDIPDSTHIQILTTRNGSTNIGRIIEVKKHEIRFETDFGVVTIPAAEIEEVKEVPLSAIRNGQYWFSNPNATRLYFAPTGRMLKQGEGYFSDVYLFFPGVAYGVTNNITIGGGLSLFPGVDMNKQLFYFTPKVGLTATRNLNLAAGLLLIRVPDESATAGIFYGVSTYGASEGSVTMGFGYGFVDSDVAEKPMIMVGGEVRLSRRSAFVTENWIFPEVDQPLISYGFRFFGEKLSVDLALWSTIGPDAIFPGIPYIDFVVNF
jgi:hypothetical protein